MPLQVTIWKKTPEGGRKFVTRESKYLRVKIAGAKALEPPAIRIFRQVSRSPCFIECLQYLTDDSS